VLSELRDERLVHDVVLDPFPVLPEPIFTPAHLLYHNWVLIESYLFLVIWHRGIFHGLVVVLGRGPDLPIDIDFGSKEVGHKFKLRYFTVEPNSVVRAFSASLRGCTFYFHLLYYSYYYLILFSGIYTLGE
jgi:hypothetical protein